MLLTRFNVILKTMETVLGPAIYTDTEQYIYILLHFGYMFTGEAKIVFY